MADSSSPFDPRAEQLFLEFLRRRDAGENPVIEELCRAEPRHATQLWQLLSAYEAASRLRQRAVEPTLAERLKRQFGEGVDPIVSLGGEPKPDSGPQSKLFERLHAEGHHLRSSRSGFDLVMKLHVEGMPQASAARAASVCASTISRWRARAPEHFMTNRDTAMRRLLRIGSLLGLTTMLAGCSRPPHQTDQARVADTETIVCPKIWDEKELAAWATPVAGLGVRPGHFSEAEYYAAPIVNLRTYPVYHPKFEPPGYRERIKSQGPQRLIEPEKLKTKADWIEAGRVVFEGLSSPGFSISDPAVLAFLSDAEAIDAHDDIVTKDGHVLPYRWVVDQSGELKVSAGACTSCHYFLLPDKSVVYGPGPGHPPKVDKPASPVFAALLATVSEPVVQRHSEGEVFYSYFGVPWVAGDEHARFKTMSDEEVVAWFNSNETDIAGATARNNGSPFYTTRVADLLGVRHRRYLDATATHANRGPEDIARYGILVEYADNFVFGPHKLEFPEQMKVTARAPNEALYAMGLYLYSLEPLPSPHPFDEQARRGQGIFEAEGCTECHTPPTYTNNKLVRAPGFESNMEDAATEGLNISNRRVNTDPGLALKTRKGTGYYKIPSLRGLWYRGLFEHSGSVSSLEEWFDPKRLRDDYVPSGWKGPGVKTRAVPGHKFGHDLSEEDKKALIAFLKTL